MLNYLPHKNKIFMKLCALNKYFVHQCDIRSSLVDEISFAFCSNLVSPVIKNDLKCSCAMKYDIWI
jgi:hypothetical protein